MSEFEDYWLRVRTVVWSSTDLMGYVVKLKHM